MPEDSRSIIKRYKGLTPLILFALVLVVVGFYWYEWRPSQIKKECYVLAEEEWNKSEEARGFRFRRDLSLDEQVSSLSLDELFTNCLREMGL